MQTFTLPLFPLPNAVLFPGVYLPLHIFEPRYRVMVADALQGERLIGMCLLKPIDPVHETPAPAVYPVGCAGTITHVHRLDDGRYNIVLEGSHRFRILREDHALPYRVGTVEPLTEKTGAADAGEIARLREQLGSLLECSDGKRISLPEGTAEADVINAMAQYLELEPIERQALLECATVIDRGRALVDLVAMRRLGIGGAVH